MLSNQVHMNCMLKQKEKCKPAFLAYLMFWLLFSIYTLAERDFSICKHILPLSHCPFPLQSFGQETSLRYFSRSGVNWVTSMGFAVVVVVPSELLSEGVCILSRTSWGMGWLNNIYFKQFSLAASIWIIVHSIECDSCVKKNSNTIHFCFVYNFCK